MGKHEDNVIVFLFLLNMLTSVKGIDREREIIEAIEEDRVINGLLWYSRWGITMTCTMLVAGEIKSRKKNLGPRIDRIWWHISSGV